MTRVYIAGPMTGLPDFNYPAFHAAAEYLRRLGHDVINPAELNPPDLPWHQCMRQDIAALATCEAVYVLPGWERSRGATLEVFVARRLDIPVKEFVTMELMEWKLAEFADAMLKSL